MTNETKEQVLHRIAREHQELQQLEAGHWPKWASGLEREENPPLNTRRMYADWCLGEILRGVLPGLPKHVRIQIQACLDMRNHIWSTEYLQAYYAPQQETSPTSLAAVDSF